VTVPVTSPRPVAVAPRVLVTTVTLQTTRCADDLAKLALRRSQLDAELAGLTSAEASARSAGRTVEADFLRVEMTRVQRDQAQAVIDLQRRQAQCAGVPIAVPPVSAVPAMAPIHVPATNATIPPACRGAHGQIRSTSVHIRNESREAARALAASIRARSRGEVATADKQLASATKHQQQVAMLNARYAALVAACPASV